MTLKPECRRCNEKERIVKNGFVRGKQRYKCCQCSFNFVMNPEPRSVVPPEKKELAIKQVLSGMSERAAAHLVGVSPTSVGNWIQKAGNQIGKPSPTENVVSVELDEMWHYVKKNDASCGYGRRTLDPKRS